MIEESEPGHQWIAKSMRPLMPTFRWHFDKGQYARV